MLANTKYPTFALSITNMILRAFIQAFIPLYPFIMARFNASSSDVGIFLSLTYGFLFLGTYLAGLIVPVYIKPKTMLIITLICLALALSGYGVSVQLCQFEVCGCLLSFFLGIHICSNSIMMGYYSTATSVSKNFSSLATSSLLATVLGGFIVGPVISWLGALYAFYSFTAVLILCTLFFLPMRQPEYYLAKKEKIKFTIDRNLWLLLLALLLINLLPFGFKMSIAVMLKKRGWDIRDISILMAIGTSLALPIALWWGRLSNYKNTRTLLLITFFCGLMAYASLFLIGSYAAGVVGFTCISVVAYIITIPIMSILFTWYDHKYLPRAQALATAVVWASAIIGFAVNGYALEHLSQSSYVFIGTLIALLAIIPLLRIKMVTKLPPIGTINVEK
jgi:predicted MFS family arabinose efflux permease